VNQKVEKFLSVGRDVSVFGVAVLLYAQSAQIGNIFAQARNVASDLSRISTKHDKIADLVKETSTVVDAVRVQRESKLVKFDELLHECEASNSEATCVITNLNEYAVTTCFVGTITRKDSSMKIHTMIGCTGRMEPRSTVKVSAPFHRARANYLCPREGLSSFPDWDKCDFSVAVPSTDNVKP
jgi:hypothetical protein